MRYLLALLLLLTVPASAATIVVDPAGGGDATTIIDGLALATNIGDIVECVDGTYTSTEIGANRLTQVRFKANNVVLQAQNTGSATISSSPSADALVYGQTGATGCVIKGFVIESGGVANSYLVRGDAGGFSPVSFEDCTISDFSALYYEPGASGLKDGPTFTNCTVSNMRNDPPGGWYVFAERRCDNLTFVDCDLDFSSNTKSTANQPDILLQAVYNASFTRTTLKPSTNALYGLRVGGDTVNNSSTITFDNFELINLPASATKGVYFGGSTEFDAVDSILIVESTLIGHPAPSGTQYVLELENDYVTEPHKFFAYPMIRDTIITGGTVGFVSAEGVKDGDFTRFRISGSTSTGLLIQDTRDTKFSNFLIQDVPDGIEIDDGGVRAHNSNALEIVDGVLFRCTDGIFKDVATDAQDTNCVYARNVFALTDNVANIAGTTKTLAQWQTYQPAGPGPAAGVLSVDSNDLRGLLRRVGVTADGMIRYLGGNGLR